MDSSPHHDAAQEPGTPRDPPRESSDDESLVDHKLEETCKAALEANERFLALQRQSHEKATPPTPALMPHLPRLPRRGHLIGCFQVKFFACLPGVLLQHSYVYFHEV